jgi:cytochrome P450
MGDCMQAFVMLLAGYETTANALAFTLYLLAANQNEQLRLCEEVDAFGCDKVPSYDDLERLPYVEACLKEALRLYPPAPTHIREAARDMTIGGYHVRKGQWLGVAVYSMHRNPNYWKVRLSAGWNFFFCSVSCPIDLEVEPWFL